MSFGLKFPPSQGDQQVQVAVIGGGFTGVSTALNLAERGFNVHLFEAERIGYGASGRNGGQFAKAGPPILARSWHACPKISARWRGCGNAGRQIIIDAAGSIRLMLICVLAIYTPLAQTPYG